MARPRTQCLFMDAKVSVASNGRPSWISVRHGACSSFAHGRVRNALLKASTPASASVAEVGARAGGSPRGSSCRRPFAAAVRRYRDVMGHISHIQRHQIAVNPFGFGGPRCMRGPLCFFLAETCIHTPRLVGVFFAIVLTGGPCAWC
jgi:hypothetical protein